MRFIRQLMTKTYIFLTLFILSSCASQPVLYPNSKLKKVGKERGQHDIEICTAEAEEYLENGKGKKIAKGAGAGAVIGGAMGAVAGIFAGDLGRGAFQGAAIGAAGGGTAGALSPDEIKRSYVNQCLEEKGYQILGWD